MPLTREALLRQLQQQEQTGSLSKSAPLLRMPPPPQSSKQEQKQQRQQRPVSQQVQKRPSVGNSGMIGSATLVPGGKPQHPAALAAMVHPQAQAQAPPHAASQREPFTLLSPTKSSGSSIKSSSSYGSRHGLNRSEMRQELVRKLQTAGGPQCAVFQSPALSRLELRQAPWESRPFELRDA